MVQVVADKEEVRRICDEKRRAGVRVALVPTMGALHEGHLSLVRRAAGSAGFVVVSIFVNPTQFGPSEDFGRYPRDLAGDVRLLETVGASLVFAPDASSMYAPDHSTWVTVENVSGGLCGAARPGHFRGVATVVAKLFTIVHPDVAVFGQKDAQQVAVIRRMVRDLDMGIEIVAAPIVREPDGLAMSSRNCYLSPDERREALVLSRALDAAREMLETGETGAEVIKRRVRELIEGSPLAGIEYIEIVHPDTIAPVETTTDGALLALAVKFGNTRLIDNVLLVPSKG